MVRPTRSFAAVAALALAACNGGQPARPAPAPPRAAASASASAPPPPGPDTIVQIAAGDGFWCARRNDGSVRCTGASDHGQLGAAAGHDVAALSGATSIVASGDHACALRAGGTVVCWGGRDHGKPVEVDGVPFAAAAAPPPAGDPVVDPLQVETMRVDVSDGSAHVSSCALRKDGAVMCWGANDLGQLGDGTTTDRAKPVRVAGIADAAEIRLEWGRACARLRDGAVKCWGDNERGLLVAGGAAILKTAVAIKGIAGAAHIAVGAEHACAALKDGTLRCWGDADDMPNGWDAAVKDAPQPVTIPDVAKVAGVVARASETCVWRDDGRVQCWHKAGKETGLDATWDDDNFVPWIDDAVDVAIGKSEWCAKTRAGRARCWGERWYGEPTSVPALKDATEIADGPLHACARTQAGEARCWGWNVEGSLGVYGRGLVDEPVTVALAGVAHVAVGAMHSVALLADGTVRAWKPSFGKGEVAIATVDVRASAIAAGAHHACALRDGAVVCWGESRRGQLGAEVRDGAGPLAIPGVTGAVAVAAGHDRTCALLDRGAVVCWGATSNDAARAPAIVPGLVAKQIAVGDATYALRADGAVVRVDANRAVPVDPG